MEFWFDADHGASGDKNCGFTHMVDVVERHYGEYFFIDKDIECGARPGRFNRICEVIGNIHDLLHP